MFINGVIHDNTKCPICDVVITDINKETKIKNENKLNKSELIRLKRTTKTLDKLKKQAEKAKKLAEREKKKVEREEKKRLREERKAMRENKNSLKIGTRQMDLGTKERSWFTDYWVFEDLPDNLIVKPGFDGKYIAIQTGPNTSDYEVGYFLRVKEKFNKEFNDYEVEYYSETLGVHTVPSKSTRRYIKGQDKLGKIHTIDQYLKRNRGT